MVTGWNAYEIQIPTDMKIAFLPMWLINLGFTKSQANEAIRKQFLCAAGVIYSPNILGLIFIKQHGMCQTILLSTHENTEVSHSSSQHR